MAKYMGSVSGHGEMRRVETETPSEAAGLFADRIAHRVYGRRGLVRILREDSHSMNGTFWCYQAYIGVPVKGGGTSGHNIWVRVSR
jgi:hypothetical protein